MGNKLKVCCFILAILCPELAIPGIKDEKSNSQNKALEKAVADLVKVKHTHTAINAYDPDPYFWKVVLLGFDAVPSLIGHLNDRRLTQAERGYFNNFPGYQLEVRHVASVILERLAGRSLDRGPLERQQGIVLRQADVEGWWKKARVIGEEHYLVDHVLEKRYPKDVWPNDVMLAIITKKYPERLGDIYRKALENRPELETWPLAKAIADSRLDKKTKQKLIFYGLNHKDLKHRTYALRQLAKLDPPLFDKQVVHELNCLPKSFDYRFWDSPEAAMSFLVCQTKNPAVWKAFQGAAERCEVGLRMEFLGGMQCLEKSPTIKEQLRFLAHFLGDKTVRDVSTTPKRFTGPYAAADFPRIEVRNYAAICIGEGLEIEAYPSPKWTPNEWAKFRKKIRSALEKNGIGVAEKK
jgi:hypothetical protein